jgi:hypothetical protein
VSGTVTACGPDGTTASLRIAWPKEPGATATLGGTVGGRALRATMPAP